MRCRTACQTVCHNHARTAGHQTTAARKQFTIACSPQQNVEAAHLRAMRPCCACVRRSSHNLCDGSEARAATCLSRGRSSTFSLSWRERSCVPRLRLEDERSLCHVSGPLEHSDGLASTHRSSRIRMEGSALAGVSVIVPLSLFVLLCGPVEALASGARSGKSAALPRMLRGWR